jgi:hypothetical protein
MADSRALRSVFSVQLTERPQGHALGAADLVRAEQWRGRSEECGVLRASVENARRDYWRGRTKFAEMPERTDVPAPRNPHRRYHVRSSNA